MRVLLESMLTLMLIDNLQISREKFIPTLWLHRRSDFYTIKHNLCYSMKHLTTAYLPHMKPLDHSLSNHRQSPLGGVAKVGGGGGGTVMVVGEDGLRFLMVEHGVEQER